jgi:hypothetical protein
MALRAGRTQEMVGIINGELIHTPFEQVVKQNAKMSGDMIEMIRVLAV